MLQSDQNSHFLKRFPQVTGMSLFLKMVGTVSDHRLSLVSVLFLLPRLKKNCLRMGLTSQDLDSDIGAVFYIIFLHI